MALTKYIAVSNVRDKVLPAAKQILSSKEYNNLVSYYEGLRKAEKDHLYAIFDTADANVTYYKALKSHKVDPYLAGGAANAIGGVGAGIVTAAGMANRNASIDQARKEGFYNTLNAQMAQTSASINHETCGDRILGIISSYPKLKAIYDVEFNRLVAAEQERKNLEKKKAEEKRMNLGIIYGVTIVVIVLVLITVFTRIM